MFLKFFPTPLLFLLLCSLSAILADYDADPTRSTMEQFSGYPTQEPDSVSSFSVDTVSSFSVDAQGLQKQWVFMGPFNGPHKLYFTINWE
ncbi:hypothetical protein CK203_095546 [Vitis vinifera]|uniref:Uncharacterized protein n=1 Tax=Vitis vinifera TaxID=29760 RepID=A0A438F5Y7_VITVI|nr:hypothetical protein CK203_095546 [Vitis vinifera]